MTDHLTPTALVIKLRQQARAMKAGPNSLLHQAADMIEEQQRMLVTAARVIADSVPASEAERQES